MNTAVDINTCGNCGKVLSPFMGCMVVSRPEIFCSNGCAVAYYPNVAGPQPIELIPEGKPIDTQLDRIVTKQVELDCMLTSALAMNTRIETALQAILVRLEDKT